ncbi:hypothetical protein [Roseovarius sp. M141]|uniref:alpha/beta hydrolase family protein n=1 Tax=Roseovarius sp. M141 TaxID=2583806 RepID=UPI0020CEF56D|nr:hypothetical protein [Roseovarius sp. M141]
MSKQSIFAAIALSTWAITAQAQDAIAFKEFTIPDAQTNRPLTVGVWYPTTSYGPVTTVGENSVFYGAAAQTNAQPSVAAHPLVVLSHGYGGTWRNLSWVAQALVSQGYVVAAPNHPGTTAFERTQRTQPSFGNARAILVVSLTVSSQMKQLLARLTAPASLQSAIRLGEHRSATLQWRR